MVIALSGIGLSSQVVGAGKPLQSISMLAEDGGPYYEQITRGAESVAKAIDSAVPISLPLAVAAELPLPKAPVGSAAEHFAAIEARSGGRLGVAALDIGSGKRIDYRANERFAMCSTFKAVLAAAVLKRVDEHEQRLSDLVEYNETDLLDYAPVTKEHVKEGGMTVDALCAAAVEYSDNTAANLLLRTIGGPDALTRYLRSVGDRVSRLDRIEPDLNSAIVGDERDTTTPAAMLENLRVLLLADALSAESRGILEGWLMQSKTGAATIRAGLPSTWRFGNKTGRGEHGATNDIAIVRPPNGAPVLIAIYFAESSAPAEERSATIAEAARAIARAFGETSARPVAPSDRLQQGGRRRSNAKRTVQIGGIKHWFAARWPHKAILSSPE